MLEPVISSDKAQVARKSQYTGKLSPSRCQRIEIIASASGVERGGAGPGGAFWGAHFAD